MAAAGDVSESRDHGRVFTKGGTTDVHERGPPAGNEGRISIVGAARSAPGLEFRSAQYDLGRSVRGDLYVAMEQEGDGHGGIPAAAAAGAAGVLCTAPHPEAPPDVPQFVSPTS